MSFFLFSGVSTETDLPCGREMTVCVSIVIRLRKLLSDSFSLLIINKFDCFFSHETYKFNNKILTVWKRLGGDNDMKLLKEYKCLIKFLRRCVCTESSVSRRYACQF